MGAGHSHAQGHGHSHAHGHSHGAAGGSTRRLAITLALVATYMVAELVGGLLANSLALLADAGHMFSDVAALALSLFAIWFARRPATARHTYGFYRTEILAALANGATLVAISALIIWEAVGRFRDPPEVQGGLVMAIAAGGLLINGAGLWLLHGGRNENLNVRGAWLHVMTDALGSVQAIIAGALIWWFGWQWVDPAASVLIGLLVVYSSWALLKESVAVLMERAPGHIDVDQVRESLFTAPGVAGVHDLHVWTITSGRESLSAHVVAKESITAPALLGEIRRMLHERFGINHVTIQIEPEGFDECGATPCA